MNIEFIENPNPDTVSTIRSGLVEFNRSSLENVNETDFALVIQEADKPIMGGMTGTLFKSGLYIRFLWVSEALRGQGFGQALMQTIEREAKQRGIKNLFVDTYSFQAPAFYQAAGFIEVGRFSDYIEPGVDKIFYQKVI